MKKIGIIICARYSSCAGGKCLKALREKHGAFSIYGDEKGIELVGFASCGGCPGGNVEYVPEEMIKNGAEVIHLATGFIVGYPPCPNLNYFRTFIEQRYGVKVVVGTHPIPKKYMTTHANLCTWNAPEWKEILQNVTVPEKIRDQYD